MFTFATPFFYIGLGSGIRDPRSGIRNPGSGIRDEQILGSGSGIKHPGSATLLVYMNCGLAGYTPKILQDVNYLQHIIYH
jgi:hypothetical protein